MFFFIDKKKIYSIIEHSHNNIGQYTDWAYNL